MTGVAILAPGYPDTPGGVTDHTARLVRHWSAAGVPVQVMDRPGDVEQVDRWKSRKLQALLIQYVPFLYGRRGLSNVPERLARAAKEAGRRVTVFVHEPWVPPSRLPWLILSPLQQRQLRRVLHVADAVVTAVPAWQHALGERTRLLPVGSTLGDPPPHAEGPTLPSPVVFSPFASGLRWEWITAAATMIAASPPLIILGATHREATEHPDVGTWAYDSWDWRGRLEPGVILDVLSRARLVLAPFVDGMTGRRTSALAALSTGARTVSSTGHLFDPVFAEAPLTVSRNLEEFVQDALQIWSQDDTSAARLDRREWYNRRFDARVLDQELLRIVMGERIRPSAGGGTPILEPA